MLTQDCSSSPGKQIEKAASFTMPATTQRRMLMILALLLSLIALNWAAPSYLDADTTLQAIMSTQKVTQFYWGQDRFLNFFPFIFSWIARTKTNLLVHMFVMGATYFLLLEVIADNLARLKYKGEANKYRTPLFLGLTLVSILTLWKAGIYMFAFAAQPYASSLLFLSYCAYILNAAQPRSLKWSAAGVLALVSTGLNPSIIVICGAICLFLFLRRSRELAVHLALVTLGAFLFWHISGDSPAHGAMPYFKFSPAAFPLGLKGLLQSYLADNGSFWPLSLIVFAGALGLTKGWAEDQADLKIARLIAIAIGVAWIILFCSNKWVGLNGFHFRYFFPAFLAMIILATEGLLAIFFRFRSLPHKATAWALLIAILAVIARPPVKLQDYANINHAASISQFAATQGAKIIAGNYWTSWNVVFLMNRTRHSQENVVYGGAYRGVAMRPEIESMVGRHLSRDQNTVALCVENAVVDCIFQLKIASGYDWKETQTGDCADQCFLLAPVKN